MWSSSKEGCIDPPCGLVYTGLFITLYIKYVDWIITVQSFCNDMNEQFVKNLYILEYVGTCIIRYTWISIIRKNLWTYWKDKYI